MTFYVFSVPLYLHKCDYSDPDSAAVNTIYKFKDQTIARVSLNLSVEAKVDLRFYVSK